MRASSFLPLLILTAALAACGGGGGGGDTGGTPTPTTPTTPTVSTLEPAAGMTWSTQAETTLNVVVNTPDGTSASNAAVRVLTASYADPQDSGATLAEATAGSMLDSAVTGADGQANVALRLPAHVTELMLVVTSGDLQAQKLVKVTSTSLNVEITLAR